MKPRAAGDKGGGGHRARGQFSTAGIERRDNPVVSEEDNLSKQY